METDTEKDLSVSQTAHNPEVGAETEASPGPTDKKTEETTKIIKASQEDVKNKISEEASEIVDVAEDNGNVTKENGVEVKENGNATQANGESVKESEDGEKSTENGENGETEKDTGEVSKAIEATSVNGEAVQEDTETTTEDGENKTEEVASSGNEAAIQEVGKTHTEEGENKTEQNDQQITVQEENIDAVQTDADPSPSSSGQQEEDTLTQETQDGEKAPALDTQDPETHIQNQENTDNNLNPETQTKEITEDISTPVDAPAEDAEEAVVAVDEENNTEAPATAVISDPEESNENVIQDEVTTDEPVTEVQDAIDVDQVQVKIAVNTDEMECVLENVAMVGDQVSNVAEHDPMEEDLESFAPAPVPIPVKEEKTMNQENQEQVLVDDEEMVITQITHLDELDPNVSVETNGDGQTKVIITTPVAPVTKAEGLVDIDQFTDTEDLVIYALDTISPFDAKFISQHMADRDEHQIERRLVDNAFRKKSFNFQKLPLMMFEMVFVSESNERMPNLMILTQKQLLQLTPKGSYCQYGPGIETIEMHYTNKTRFGIDTSALCEFIITNIPNMHMPYLR